jgi:hypothetical protein
MWGIRESEWELLQMLDEYLILENGSSGYGHSDSWDVGVVV